MRWYNGLATVYHVPQTVTHRHEAGLMDTIGVIHGRFQVLHNDHLAYLLAAKARCEHLVVGITNPDPLLTREDAADPRRAKPTSNPLTYFERYVMVQAALRGAKVGNESFSVVPFPINIPELYRYYVPMDAVFFMTICDEWGRRKFDLLTAQGLKVEVMWERSPESKGLTGAQVRNRMIAGEPWEHLVPTSTADLVKRWGLEDRLRELGRDKDAVA
jgi:nicotinamide mononucleotide adenylyltransferase